MRVCCAATSPLLSTPPPPAPASPARPANSIGSSPASPARQASSHVCCLSSSVLVPTVPQVQYLPRYPGSHQQGFCGLQSLVRLSATFWAPSPRQIFIYLPPSYVLAILSILSSLAYILSFLFLLLVEIIFRIPTSATNRTTAISHCINVTDVAFSNKAPNSTKRNLHQDRKPQPAQDELRTHSLRVCAFCTHDSQYHHPAGCLSGRNHLQGCLQLQD